MKSLTRILFVIVLAICVLALYAWVNLWLPQNTVGLLYDNQDGNNKPVLVEKQIFYWNWKRIIPHKTSIITIPTTQTKHENTLSLYLPDAYALSSQINRSVDAFKISVNSNLRYSIDTTKILEYIEDTYQGIRPHNAYSVTHQLSNEIETEYIRLDASTQLQSLSLLENKDISQQLKTMLVPKIKTALAGLPIAINSVDIEILQLPDMALYQFLTSSNNTVNEFENISKEENPTSLWLTQYLLFVKELASIADSSPKVIDIITVLPPNVLKDSINGPKNIAEEFTEE